MPLLKTPVDVNSFYDRPFEPYTLTMKDWLLAGLLFVVAFVVYIATLPPGLIAGDHGEMTTAIYNIGACHPPGYPLYMTWGKVFTYLPFGDVAFRVNLMTAFFGALTIPFLFLFILKLIRTSVEKINQVRDWGVASAATLAFAFSYTMWSKALVGKMYTLNIVFAPILLLAALYWQEHIFRQLGKGRVGFAERYLLLVAFAVGLSFTNHLLLAGYFIPIVLFAAGVLAVSNSHAKRDPSGFNEVFTHGAAIATSVLIAGLLILNHAWNVPLMGDDDSLWTIFALFLPVYTLGISATVLSFQLPERKPAERHPWAGRLLGVGALALVAFFVLVQASDPLFRSLSFMERPGNFQAVLWMFLFAGLVVIGYAAVSLRKHRSPEFFLAETVAVAFKAYVFFLIPLLLYVSLLIRANAIARIPDPPLSWGETANASRVINHFLRKQYPKSAFTFWNRLGEILGTWGNWHLRDFTLVLLAFAPLGLWSFFRRNALWAALTTLCFLTFNGLLLYFLAFATSPREQSFNEVFFIPSYFIVAVWIAFGLQWSVDRIAGFFERRRASAYPDATSADAAGRNQGE